MKNKSKIYLFVVMVLALLLAIFAFPTGASKPDPVLSIDYCNLSFRDAICIKFAVKAENADNVTMLVWTKPQTQYEYGTQMVELNSVGVDVINDISYMIFDYTGLAAKQMTDVVYARAYAEIDGQAYYSQVEKHSVLEYAYRELGKIGTAATTDEKFQFLLNDMLQYGASAQTYLGYTGNGLATENFYEVKVVGGRLADQCDDGLYLPETQLTITAPSTNETGQTFSHWEDSTGAKVAVTATATITISEKNEVYTAVYAIFSDGLEFDSNGNGTCCLVDIGTCDDTDVVIPPVSADGDIVTEIDGSVFASSDIKSITIPNTVTDIGRKAFYGCRCVF